MDGESNIVLAVVGLAFARYALLAGLGYALCYRPGLAAAQRFKIQPRTPRARQIQHELRYSSATACIFAGLGVVVYWLFTRGYTTLYTDVHAHGWTYFGFSFLAVLVFHDAYFYWTHRLLHTRWLFRHVHAVHHRSTNPTPWAAYCFHPVEAILEGLVVFPIILVFPVHLYVLAAFLGLVLTANVIGHLGYEFVPAAVRTGFPGRYFTSSTHHNLHHQLFTKNYGYYFSHWDNWLRTAQPPPGHQPEGRRP